MKIALIFVSLVILLSNSVFAVFTNPNDSLEDLLKKARTDTAKARIMNILAWNLKTTDTEKSWEYVNNALAFAKRNNSHSETGASYNTIGTLYYLVKSLDSALLYFNRAFAEFEKAGLKKKAGSCLQNMAVVYNDKSDYNAAINQYRELLDLWIELKDTVQTANVYNNMGNSYNLMGDYDKAMANFIRAIELYEKKNIKDNLSTAYYNMGALHYYKGDYNNAISYCMQSLSIRKEINNMYGVAYSYILKGAIHEAKREFDSSLTAYNSALDIEYSLGDKQGISTILVNIANVQASRGNLSEARTNAHKALVIAKEIGIRKLEISIYNNLGNIEIQSGAFKNALKYYLRAGEIADSTGDKPELREAYRGISTAYSGTGDFKNAYSYFLMYNDLKDSLLNEEKDKLISEMNAKYQSDKKEKEILLLSKDKQLQKAELQKRNEQVKSQRLAIISILIILVIVIFSGFFLLKLYRQKRKMNKVLVFQNEEILQKNEEITTQRDEIEVQRDEIITQRDLVTSQKEEIEKIHKEVSDSINYATRLQSAVLPDNKALHSIISDSMVLYMPKDKVSGDFYWWAVIEKHLVIAVADCTGHGVPGAFMSMLGISFLREIVVKEYMTNPAIILKRLRKEIINALKQSSENNSGTGTRVKEASSFTTAVKDGMDMSLVSINTETLEAQFAGANNPMYLIKNKELVEFKGDKMPIAIHERLDPFTNKEITLQKGDIIYLFSDGYADQFGGPNCKKFMSKRMKEILVESCELPLALQYENLKRIITEWKGNNEQVDDITVMGIKI